MDRETFISLRGQYLTSSPIQSPEHLKGRDRALRSLVDALQAPGRHAFIYGYRGVGKSSLTQTAAYQLQYSSGAPVFVACDSSSTFSQLCSDIIKAALRVDPLEKKGQNKLSLGANLATLGGANIGFERGSQPISIDIGSVNDAILYFQGAAKKFLPGFVVLIDEFDQLSDPLEHRKFATLIKQLSDQRLPIRLIFCGIAESIDRLFAEHESIFRLIHSENVDRLAFQACLDIISDAAIHLKIPIDKGYMYRIAKISDGFPYFVHLICEKIFTVAFDRELSKVDSEAYADGIDQAITSVEFSLKRTYENALHKNTRKYEHVIWAVANHRLLDVNIDDIWSSYVGICDKISISPVRRENIITKLNQLTQPAYGEMLKKPRRSNFTFSEKMMRAYARLRAERVGCSLGPENPY